LSAKNIKREDELFLDA